MGYNLKFYISDKSNTEIKLIKKINFSEKMCDLYSVFNVPGGTGTTKITFNLFQAMYASSWGRIEAKLTEPADEFITISIRDGYNNDYNIIISPGATSAWSTKDYSGSSFFYRFYLYVGKKLIYSYTDSNSASLFKNTYFNNYITNSGAPTLYDDPKPTISLEYTKETQYMLPLIKDNTKSAKKSYYNLACRYNGEMYQYGVIVKSESDTDIDSIRGSMSGYIPEEVDISDSEIKDIYQKKYDTSTMETYIQQFEDGESLYIMKFSTKSDDGSLSPKIWDVSVWVRPGDRVIQIPIKDKNGDVIDYVLVSENDGKINDTDSHSKNDYEIKMLNDGSTVVYGEDGSITINNGENNPNGGNTTTYYPTGETDSEGNPIYEDKNGNRFTQNDKGGMNSYNPESDGNEGGDDSGEGGETGGDTGDTGEGEDGGNEGGSGEDSGSGDSGSGSESGNESSGGDGEGGE